MSNAPAQTPDAEDLPMWDYKRAWDPKGTYTMAIIGSSKSGKSTFLSWLYEQIAHNFDIKVMASTNCHVPIYSQFREHDGHLIEKFSPAIIKALHYINSQTNNYFSMLNMVDDQIDLKEDPVIKQCFVTLRNARINTIYSTQSWSYINKAVRGNLQYVCLMKLNSLEEIVDVCDKFLLNHLFKGLTDPATRRPMTRARRLQLCIDWYKDATDDYYMVIIENINNFKFYQFRTPDEWVNR